jgi:hypothetical protein
MILSLLKLTPARVVSQLAICCPVCWSTCLAMRIKQYDGGRHEHQCQELVQKLGAHTKQLQQWHCCQVGPAQVPDKRQQTSLLY